MSVTVQECKDYLRLPADATVEDGLIERLIRSAAGMIESFIGRPIEGAGGLSELPDFDTRIEPAISQDVIDVVAMLYHQRSPTASSESEGGGITQSWDDVGKSGLPKRVEGHLRQYLSESITGSALPPRPAIVALEYTW